MARRSTKIPDAADGVSGTMEDTAVRSSGNVYADLGFEDPAAESLKADLLIGIIDDIERSGLSQAMVGRLIGLSQPDVSKLLRGRTGGYSLERLLIFARALGGDVEITVRRNGPDHRGRMRLQVLEPA